MEMTYEEMMREAEAYYAASAHVPVERRLTRHEEMLCRLSDGNKELHNDAMLAVLRRLFTAEEAEIFMMYPPVSAAAPLTPDELESEIRPSLRPQLKAITKKLLDQKVLIPAQGSAECGYFARCDRCCMEQLCRAAVQPAACSAAVRGRRAGRLAPAKKEKVVQAPVRVTAGVCVGCKLCMRFCGNHAIRVLGKNVLIDGACCSGCGTCAAKCPKKALRLEKAV